MKIFLYFCYIIFFSIIKVTNGLTNYFEYSCEECTYSDYGSCTKCRSAFTLIDGTCPCSFSSCALCTNGYAGLQICEQCKDGYYRYEKNCYCEVDNCEQCAEDGCIKCISGYFYNETIKQCVNQSDEEKIQCYDLNCEGCYSTEQEHVNIIKKDIMKEKVNA